MVDNNFIRSILEEYNHLGMIVFEQGFELAHQLFPDGGTCLEFGVGSGHSFSRMAQRLCDKYKKTKIIGFDSWQGLPSETKDVWCPERHTKGMFKFNKVDVLRRLSPMLNLDTEKRIRLVDGFFEESLTESLRKEITNLIFVNIDVDIHKSTHQALDFIAPLLQENTLLYFDDWKDPDDVILLGTNVKWGEHLAWEQWCEKHPGVESEVVTTSYANQPLIRIKATGGIY